MSRPSVLFITYFFPPMGGGGVQRPAKFIKYLSRLGWDVHVLTTASGHYDALDETLMRDVSVAAQVIRAPHALVGLKSALRRIISPGNSKRSAEKTGEITAKATLSPARQRLVRLGLDILHVIPDMNFDWYWPAVAAAQQHFQRHGRPDIVFSTALPITSNFIGWRLADQFRVPWISEYRDMWTNNPYQPYCLCTKRKLDRSWERRMLQSADLTITVTPGFLRHLWRIAPNQIDRMHLLRNGYDPEDFRDIGDDATRLSETAVSPDTPIRIVHMGRMYLGRNPVPLFEALSELYAGGIERGTFKVDFYGPAAPETFGQAVRKLGLEDDVTFHGYVSHEEATKILCRTPVKLLVESAMDVLPGKVYEYAASPGHILAIAPPQSEIAVEMQQTGCSTTVSFSVAEIAEALRKILRKTEDGTLEYNAEPEYLRTRSRAWQAGQLDAWMRQLLDWRQTRSRRCK